MKQEEARMVTLLRQGGIPRAKQFYQQARSVYTIEARSVSLRSDRRREMRSAAKTCRDLLNAIYSMTPSGDERVDYRTFVVSKGWHAHDLEAIQ